MKIGLQVQLYITFPRGISLKVIFFNQYRVFSVKCASADKFYQRMDE